MGYEKHHAIIITSWNEIHIKIITEKALEFKLQIIGPSLPTINNYSTLLICPDGSKEGWKESEKGDKLRTKFINWLEKNKNFLCVEWFEVAYGGDYGFPTIERNRWKEKNK